jgi:hypothetical protein
MEKYQKALLDYEEWKENAKKEAKKNGSDNTIKRILQPKKVSPYRQCHCHQLFCVTVGSKIGSSCPIDCKDENGTPYGVDAKGHCACPICKCSCSIAFTPDAPQIVCTQHRLNDHSFALRQTIDRDKSKAILADLMKDATNTLVRNALASGKPLLKETMGQTSMAGTASAQALAGGFDPTQHPALISAMRQEVGLPTTKVILPAPIIGPNGNEINVFDMRQLSNQK